MTQQSLVAPSRASHGDMFTDHMVSSQWTEGGWQPVRLGSLRPIALHPATIGLHYAQIVFEGLKAHRRVDGSVAVFRPRDNARRFQRSAIRLAMPPLSEEMFLSAVEDLVAADGHRLPDDPELSLYLRPLMFATEPNLMLRPATEYQFLLMAFVSGAFFGDPLAPVSVWVSHEHFRAMRGGTGDIKCAANYGPSFVAQQRARAAGCQQVIWLDAAERRFVEEMGGMNLFFVRGGPDPELVTPRLTGTLLPGITRDSLLVLARRLGYRVSEEQMSLGRLRAECRDGDITEVFACGTAAVVTPVGQVRDEGTTGTAGGDFTVGDGRAGPVTLRLRQALVDIHHGYAPDPDGWMHPVG